MRRSVRLGWLVLLVLLGAGSIALVGPLRWRAKLVLLKARGSIPDLSWSELSRMLRPRSGVYLESLVRDPNPHATIRIPELTEAELAQGRELYRASCASCHGGSGEGGTAPALIGRALDHGNSDWSLYRAIARGIPGTGMPKAGLPDQDAWRVAAFVRTLQRGAVAASAGPPALDRLPSVGAGALVEARANPADWLMYSGAYDGWRYSVLDRINTRTVGRLRLLWMHQLPGVELEVETTPLVVQGVMFLTTARNGIRALDAVTGALLWSYDRELPEQLRLCCGKVNRGLAVLGTTLYLATLDAHLVALDARRGTVRWDIAVANPAAGYSFTSAPLVVRDLVIVGSAGGEFATRGFIDAYDAETGARRWRFQTIPEPGAPGHQSWAGDSWKTGGAPAWLTGSYDPATDLLFWGVGNPNPDFNGDERAGDNLYSNSVVALEAATGKLKWHFQFTPHDEHDWDSAQIPVLLDVAGREPRALLLWANRNAFYYVLERVSGRFLRARAFAEQSWAEGIDSAGRPLARQAAAPSRSGTLVHPSAEGATNWWPPAYSPRTRLLYVPTLERSGVFFRGGTEERPDGARLGGSRVNAFPARGRLLVRALEAEHGTLAWEYQLLDQPPVHPGVGGLLATAGDLVFGGAGEMLLALDARAGRPLWSFQTGGEIRAAPITYLAGGRQQITIAAGRAILTFGIE